MTEKILINGNSFKIPGNECHGKNECAKHSLTFEILLMTHVVLLQCYYCIIVFSLIEFNPSLLYDGMLINK